VTTEKKREKKPVEEKSEELAGAPNFANIRKAFYQKADVIRLFRLRVL
jgi:hypothetical protein